MRYLFRACLIAALSMIVVNSPSRSEDNRTRILWDQNKRAIAATMRVQSVPSEEPNTPGQSNLEEVRLQDIEWIKYNGDIAITRWGEARPVLSIDASNKRTSVTGILVGCSKSGRYLAVEVDKSGPLKAGDLFKTSRSANSQQPDVFRKYVEFHRTFDAGPQKSVARQNMAPEAPWSCKVHETQHALGHVPTVYSSTQIISFRKR